MREIIVIWRLASRNETSVGKRVDANPILVEKTSKVPNGIWSSD